MNKQSYILSFLMGAILCCWFFFVCNPYLKENKMLESKISEQQIQLLDFEQTIALLPQFINDREQLKEKKEYLNSKLYTKEEVIKLFKHLEEKASDYQLTVSEITPPIEELLELNNQIPDSTKPQFLNIGVYVTGTYIEFGKFIQMIENDPYFRGINICQISGSKDYNQELSLYIGFKALLGGLGVKS